MKIFYDYGLVIFLVVFMTGFFGIIINNGIRHSEYVSEFKVRCEDKGGVMFVPRGGRGWPIPECRNPAFTVDLGD